MKVFRGWYRKSNTKCRWHRVWHVSSVSSGNQIATTICKNQIPTINCDFNNNPDDKCMQCEKPPGVIIETNRCFVSVAITTINTKANIIRELRRLLKSRTYYLRLFENQGICITARWESYIDIDIYTEDDVIAKNRTKRVFSLQQIEADLELFKSDVKWLCDMNDQLALENKRRKKLKGRLTSDEKYKYFDELISEAEEKP